MWGLLTPDAQTLGAKLYHDETGSELSAPPGAMKYSIDQHVDLIERILPGHSKATDFWKIVAEVAWFIIAIEKNPLLAAEIRDSENPQDLVAALEARSQA